MKVQGVIKLKEKGVKFNFHSLALLLVLSDGYFSYYILNEIFLVFFRVVSAEKFSWIVKKNTKSFVACCIKKIVLLHLNDEYILDE